MLVLAGAAAIVVAACGGSAPAPPVSSTRPATTTVTTPTTTVAGAGTPTTPAPPQRHRKPHPPFAVGLRTMTFLDTSRRVRYPGQGSGPRRLVTIIRYPARGSASRTDVIGAAPERAAGPFPLVIFGHGFAVTPQPYAPLLRAWARAGYVVAAPLFPLGNARAPGGPNENDLVNQPRDMSFVITRLLVASGARGGLLSRLIDPGQIAVSGQSDGGDTALSVAYDSRWRDRRVRAAVILSGAEIPGVGGYDFPAPSPPLLATQGTADTINPPELTRTFYDAAAPPKYLLELFGAPHLGPYTDEQPQLGIVERVTIAFLDRYLKRGTRALARMVHAGDVARTSALEADPPVAAR
jgi:dienelactone hydrolase